MEKYEEEFKNKNDDYSSIMFKSLADLKKSRLQ